jgi:hypothetical protein
LAFFLKIVKILKRRLISYDLLEEKPSNSLLNVAHFTWDGNYGKGWGFR